MAITDELREWSKDLFTASDRLELKSIADRIDREHRMALEKVAADAFLDGAPTEAQLWDLGYIALPLDADGVPIHVGDVMENTVHPPTHREVTGVGVECFYAWEDGCGRYSQFDATCYRHHHAPTVEDVLREFYVYAERGKEHHREDVDDAVLAEYAARLRLAGEDA